MPTLLEITSTPMTDNLKQQVDGWSLVTLLKNTTRDWEYNRHFVYHVGAWERGDAAIYVENIPDGHQPKGMAMKIEPSIASKAITLISPKFYGRKEINLGMDMQGETVFFNKVPPKIPTTIFC